MSEFPWTLEGRCYKLGNDVPHGGGVIPARFITARETDPDVLIPHLFSETDPGFSTRCRAGDIVVTGRNFGMGQKATGYIAMQALGLGLLCESMSVQAHRAAIAEGLRVLPRCPGISDLCESGDLLEVDFSQGRFVNKTRGLEHQFQASPEALRNLVSHGGTAGWLAYWWKTAGKNIPAKS